MGKTFFLILFFLLLFCLNLVFSNEIIFNKPCDADNKLLLEKIELNNTNTIVYFKFTNDANNKIKIGVYSPQNKNSYYLEDSIYKKKYKLIDVEGLPKWRPEKMNYLKKFEVVDFKLIFEKIDLVFSIDIIEGEENAISTSAWNFKNMIVADIHQINILIINMLQKNSLILGENNFIEQMSKKYPYIQEFITKYNDKSENWEQFIFNWKNRIEANELVDFIIKDNINTIFSSKDISEAEQFLTDFPYSNYRMDMVSIIEQSTLAVQESEYETVQEKNNVLSYYEFVQKYCVDDCENSEFESVRDAVSKLKVFFVKKKYELNNEQNPLKYNSYLAIYGHIPYAKIILEDYNIIAENEFKKISEQNNEENYISFINLFEYSNFIDKAWEKIFLIYTNDKNIIKYEEFLKKYDNSPYYKEVDKLAKEYYKNQKAAKDKQKLLAKLKKNIKEDDIVSYKQKYRIRTETVPDNEDIIIFEIRFSGEIINVLKNTVRMKIISSELVLTDQEKNSTIEKYFNQIKEQTIGNIETIPITNLEINNIQNK